MLKPKPWFWIMCFIVVFLSLSCSESRPLGISTSLKINEAKEDSHFGEHVASLRSWLAEIQESPRLPGRLSPEGPDPKHH
ncbi:hypothetical protein P8452_11714 [Trifolium repens]|nr:hypothetical protein QL285_006753 [Trifolium repens]WJX22406.1 hypothetical protein P8452_11714 [Trifolium repens]